MIAIVSILGFGLIAWFWYMIDRIDKAYKAGCTLADPDGSRARARKKYYGF